jgi:hypothetical protein
VRSRWRRRCRGSFYIGWHPGSHPPRSNRSTTPPRPGTLLLALPIALVHTTALVHVPVLHPYIMHPHFVIFCFLAKNFTFVTAVARCCPPADTNAALRGPDCNKHGMKRSRLQYVNVMCSTEPVASISIE